MKRIIMHIDVNNAFLSWTAVLFLKQGFKYDIRNSYVVIAGDERKRAGVVLARSDACKKVGIITGEPLYKARKKCPALKTYLPNSKWYEEMSNQLFTFLKNYSPDLEIYSIDECFIDYTKIKSLYGDELLFAHKIKDEIYQKLGFTVNIGIGNNKLCAKMASDFKKPNLVHTLYEHEIETKMWPLPIEKLFGVGRKTSPKMRKLGINTIHDLAHYDQYKLSKYFKNQALKYIETANGIDNSEVVSEPIAPKGMSRTVTLESDCSNKQVLYKVLDNLVEQLSLSLRGQNKYARVVAVIIRDKYFNNKTHQTKLKNVTNLSNEINLVVKKLFDEVWDSEPLRLIGVRLDGLTDNYSYQVSLFENMKERDGKIKLEKTIDKINLKYGSQTIKRASIIKRDKPK